MSERDPIRDLENFGTPGVPVTPLAPSEVRRLGDRRRARRSAAMAAGTVAAIVAIATPFALLGGHSGDPDPTPPATSTTGLTQIPKGFPLDRDAFTWPYPGEGKVLGPGADVHPDLAAPCGVDALGNPKALDRLGYISTGPEAHDTRELLLLADERAAEDAITAVRQAVLDCPTETVEGIKLAWHIDGADTGQDSMTISRTEPTGLGGVIYQYTRVGRAILVVNIGGEGGGSAAEQTSVTTQIVPDMCIFTAGPCGETSAPGDASSPATPAAPTGTKAEIPADFPLTLDQRAMEGDGGEFTGPSRTAGGVTTEICGAPMFTMAPTDRLASTATGPEFEDSRQVTTYISAGAAIDQMIAIRAQLAGCPRFTVQSNEMIYHDYQADTGYQDSITFGLTYATGTGGVLVQLVRVGSGILALSHYGEWTVESQQANVPTMTALTRRILPAMCVFTASGC